tara:strand:- start:434 stop:559 length:126 start_codon:yes stop_codon:yes gene_type:complete
MRKPTPIELVSIKKQYSGKNYTIEDKKIVINYYKETLNSKL